MFIYITFHTTNMIGLLHQGKYYRVIARISTINIENMWFESCKDCGSPTESHHGLMVCINCNDVVHTIPR